MDISLTGRATYLIRVSSHTGAYLDTRMPCLFISWDFYRQHNPCTFTIYCCIAMIGPTTMIRESMESDQIIAWPCFSEPDGRIRQKLQVREWSRSHTYRQDHTRGWCRMLRFLHNSIGSCKRLSHLDIPLARGFDFMKKFYGLFLEHRTRKFSLCMHGFCSIPLHGRFVHALPSQTKLLCRRDIPSSSTRRYSVRRRRYHCPVRGVC